MFKRLIPLIAGLAMTHACWSQTWPEKQVRVIVPYAAGSVTDVIARQIFDRIQRTSGKVVVVENRAGASGMIGTDAVAKAAPDGHTVVVAPSAPLGTNLLLYKKMPYDPLKELAPVALLVETPSVLVVSNETAASNAPDLLKLMGKPESRLAYGSPGVGTLSHLYMAYLVSLSGGNVPHVSYPGAGQLFTNLIANHIQIATMPPVGAMSFIKAGRVKALALVGTRRSSLLPELTTLVEQGIDFSPVGWFGVATTGGTPKPVLHAMHAAIRSAMQDPAMLETFRLQGLDPADKGPDEFSAYIRDELARWRPFIAKHNINVE